MPSAFDPPDVQVGVEPDIFLSKASLPADCFQPIHYLFHQNLITPLPFHNANFRNYENASETLTYPALRHFSIRANVVLSGPDWVDIMDLNVSKGNALSFIQEKLGIAKEETMTFGDYLNDVSLLENSACSYAMANAHPDLKKIAAAIAPGNDEGGVMRVLEQAFF